jgi:hypothetical protein
MVRVVQGRGERKHRGEESGRALARQVTEGEGEGERAARTHALAPQPLFDNHGTREERVSGSTLKKAAVECLELPPLPEDPPPPRCMALKSRSSHGNQPTLHDSSLSLSRDLPGAERRS